MQNSDLQKILRSLESTAAELRKDLENGATLEPLPAAAAIVKAASLADGLTKLAGKVRPLLAPLFKRDGKRPR
jgi:hypothetical protein